MRADIHSRWEFHTRVEQLNTVDIKGYRKLEALWITLHLLLHGRHPYTDYHPTLGTTTNISFTKEFMMNNALRNFPLPKDETERKYHLHIIRNIFCKPSNLSPINTPPPLSLMFLFDTDIGRALLRKGYIKPTLSIAQALSQLTGEQIPYFRNHFKLDIMRGKIKGHAFMKIPYTDEETATRKLEETLRRYRNGKMEEIINIPTTCHTSLKLF